MVFDFPKKDSKLNIGLQGFDIPSFSA